ncbi:MAG: amidohydrolase family protein [Actinomycetota bacterium]
MSRLSVRAPLAWFGPGRLVSDARVVCDGGLIAAAGPADQVPREEREIDIDAFLMPAGADRHVHIERSDPVAVLRGGITAVRDLAWPADRIFNLADASELVTFNGPLVRAAGPMLTAHGGYPMRSAWAPPGTGRVVSGADDAATAVRELAALGATAIKVSLNAEAGPTPTDAELMAICDAAAEADIPVTAHAQGPGQVERALGAGVGELAHTPWVHLSDDVIATAAKRMRWISTLDILSFGRDTPEIRTALDNLRRFHAAGGSVGYGTDLGNGGVPPGIHTRELLWMRDAGLSYDDVLGALIRSPIVRDAPADLIALGSNPLEELTAFDDIRLVVRSGRVVTG